MDWAGMTVPQVGVSAEETAFYDEGQQTQDGWGTDYSAQDLSNDSGRWTEEPTRNVESAGLRAEGISEGKDYLPTELPCTLSLEDVILERGIKWTGYNSSYVSVRKQGVSE